MKEIANDFYNCYSYKISCIKSMEDKNNILSEMQEIFQEAVRNMPECRNELSEIYQSLKIKCEGAVA